MFFSSCHENNSSQTLHLPRPKQCPLRSRASRHQRPALQAYKAARLRVVATHMERRYHIPQPQGFRVRGARPTVPHGIKNSKATQARSRRGASPDGILWQRFQLICASRSHPCATINPPPTNHTASWDNSHGAFLLHSIPSKRHEDRF